MMGTMMENLPNGDSVSGDRCVLRTCNRAMHEWTEQQSDDVTFRHKQHDLWRAVRMFCEQVVAKAEQNVRNMLHGEISPLSQCTAVDTNASSDLGSGSAGRRTEETNVHLSSVSDRCVNKGAIHPAARLGVPDRCKGEVDFNLAACMDVTDGCAIWAESPGRSNEEECAQNIHDVENDAREVKGAHEERVQDALEKVLCGEAKKRDEKKQIQEIRREEEKDKNEEVEEGKKEDKKDSLPTPTATEECTNERNPRPATRTNTTDRRARDETDHASTRTHTSDRYLAEGRGYPSLTTCADATIGSHRQSATLVEKKGVRTSQSLKLRPEHKCANWNQDPAKPLPRNRSMELCGSKTRHATSPPVLQTSLTRGTAAHESHRTAMLDACVTNASLREHSLPLRNAAHHFDTHWMAALSPRTASGKTVNEHPSGKYTVAEEDGCRLVSSGESREDEVDEHGDLASAARDSMQCDVQEKTGFKKCLALLDEMDDSANSMELCEAIRACRSRVEAACCPPNSDEDSGLGSCTSSASDGADFFDAQECATAFDVTVPSEARVASSHTLTDISSTTLSSPKPQAVFQLPQYVPHSTTARTNTPAAASIPRSHPRGRSGRVLPPAPVYAEWLGPRASSSRISPAVSPVSSHDPDGHEELDCAEGRHIELDSCMENKDDYKDCRDTQLNLRMHAENQEPRDNENNRYNDNNYNNDNNDNNDKNDISDKNDNNDNNEKNNENNENNGNNKNNDDNDNNDNNGNDNAARCDDHQHENEDGPNNSINRIFPLAKNNVTNEDEAGVCRLIAHRDRCMAVGALDPATVETKSAPKQKHFDGFTRKLTPATRAPSCVDTANPTGDYAPVAERGSNFTVDELYAPLDETRHSSQPLLYPDTVKQSLLEPGPAIHDTRNSRDHTSTHVTRNEHQRAEGDSPRAEPYKQAHTRGASHVPRKESRIRESSPPRPHLRRTHAHQSQMRIDDLFHRELSETVESRHGVPRAERVFSPASPQKKTDTNALRNPEKDIRPATVRGNDVECLTSDPFASLYALGDARSRRALAPPTQPTRGAAPQQVDHPQEQPYGEVKAPSLVPGPEDEPWDPLAAEIEDDEESYIKQAHREVAALHGGYQFDFHEVELDDLLTNFDSRKAQQREEYELIEQCRRKSDDDLLMMYYDAVLHNRPLGPTLQDFEDRHSINFTDEYLATYLVQKVIGDVIIAQADIEWTETKNDEQSLENLIAEYPLIDQVCDVETEWDIANLEQIASSKNIFNFWAFLLDDLYTSVILPAVQQDADPRGRIENDARVRHVLESPFCAASLIQFVVLIEAPHSCQQPEEAVLRSKVALDILIVHEFANLIFSNQLLRISDVMFMCFSSIESKSLGPRVVSSHVAGLISYVYSIAPDDVISFIHNFQSSMYMLAYYIHLPGIADLCLRLILQTSDLRPVRIAGQITQPYFLEFIVRIRWFPYLINVMSDRGTDSSKLKEAAILQFFNRFFEICEIHFRSIQKDAVTSTRLYSLVHYVAVETGLTQHLLDMGLATGSMEAINVVLAILKIHPLVEGSADQVGCVLHAIFRPEMSVASPSRSRDDPEKYHDQRRALKNWGASACKSHRKTRVGAFECAQLQIIKVHLEEVKSLAWVPHDYWFLFQSWYLEREKRNHVCHPILFAIWKHFVLYAPLDVASEVLPQLIQDCMDIILAENWKDWCDLVKEPKSQKSIVAGCEITRVTHSVRFTSVGRRNGGLGTMLQFILFVAETNFLVDRGTGSSNKEMNRIRKVVGSAAFEACHQRAKEIQETTARATALALDKKRRPPSTSSTDPTVEPCEADPRTKLIDPPSISPPEPPQQQSMVALAFVDSPPWLVETRSCSAVEADESFRSGLCRLSVEDSCKYARRCEASSSNVTLSDISAELEAFEQRLQCRHVDAVDHCGIRGFHHDESIDAPLSSEEIPSPTSTATPPHSPHSDTHSSHSPTDVVHDVTLDDDDHLLRKLSPRSDGVKLALEGFVARCVENAIDAIPLRRTEKTPLAKTSVVELTIGPENASRNDVA